VAFTSSSPSSTTGRSNADVKKNMYSFTDAELQQLAKKTASRSRHRSKSVSVAPSKDVGEEELRNEVHARRNGTGSHLYFVLFCLLFCFVLFCLFVSFFHFSCLVHWPICHCRSGE
jgi:hypothetical protein